MGASFDFFAGNSVSLSLLVAGKDNTNETSIYFFLRNIFYFKFHYVISFPYKNLQYPYYGV